MAGFKSVIERFMDKVAVEPDSGCWLWQSGVSRGGYGKFKLGGKTLAAHRVSYELFVGEIPEGLTIDHVRARGCTHRNCVNPEHLEAVTCAENLRRGDSPSSIASRMTHCKNGHEFTSENTYWVNNRCKKNPQRRCRECHNNYVNEWQKAKRREANR